MVGSTVRTSVVVGVSIDASVVVVTTVVASVVVGAFADVCVEWFLL